MATDSTTTPAAGSTPAATPDKGAPKGADKAPEKKAERTVKVRTLGTVKHGGEYVAPGTELELPASEAKRLRDAKVAEAVTAAKAEADE